MSCKNNNTIIATKIKKKGQTHLYSINEFKTYFIYFSKNVLYYVSVFLQRKNQFKAYTPAITLLMCTAGKGWGFQGASGQYRSSKNLYDGQGLKVHMYIG